MGHRHALEQLHAVARARVDSLAHGPDRRNRDAAGRRGTPSRVRHADACAAGAGGAHALGRRRARHLSPLVGAVGAERAPPRSGPGSPQARHAGPLWYVDRTGGRLMGSSGTSLSSSERGHRAGINSVISALPSRRSTVAQGVGVPEGFRHLMRGDIARVRDLTIGDVSRIHLTGRPPYSVPHVTPHQERQRCRGVSSLDKLGVTHLVTIGGETPRFIQSRRPGQPGTTSAPCMFPRHHNDLPLPEHIPTFGFQTPDTSEPSWCATSWQDGRSTRRWYIVVAMGRQAGHWHSDREGGGVRH